MDSPNVSTPERSTAVPFAADYDADGAELYSNVSDADGYGKVERTTFKYVAPVLIVVGLAGNALSISVLQSRFFRRAPSTFVFSVLSVTDSGVLLCGLMRLWLVAATDRRLDVRDLSAAGCVAHVFFTYYLSQLSSWTLVLLTVERLASARWPLRARALFSRRRVAATWTATALSLAAANSHFVSTVGLVPEGEDVEKYSCFHKKEAEYFMAKIWPWIDLALKSLIPLIAIFACNVAIVLLLRKARRLRRDDMRADASKDSDAISAMLIGVSVLFFLATTPVCIYLIVIQYWPYVPEAQLNVVSTAYTVVNIAYYLSSSLNFLAYYVSRSKFRRAFVAVLTCRQLDPPPSGGGVRSKYTTSTLGADRSMSTTEIDVS